MKNSEIYKKSGLEITQILDLVSFINSRMEMMDKGTCTRRVGLGD